MKICPKCKAELDDNARFCLSCMTSLDEKEQILLPQKKKPKWLLIIAAIIVVALIVALVLLVTGDKTPADDLPPDATTTSSLTESTDPHHVHNFSVENTANEFKKSEATCTTPAIFYYSCSCGEKGSETFFYGETSDHTIVTEHGYPATCQAPGLTDGTHCSVCNAVILSQSQIPVISHTYDGDQDESCNLCGYVRVLNCSHANTVKLAAVSPTCTSGGLTEGKKCSLCEETLTAQTPLEPLGHNEVIDKAVAPTCTVDGKSEGKHCSRCELVLVYQQNILAKGHDYGSDNTLTECYVCGAEATHVHRFTRRVIASEYLKEPANCRYPAVYYCCCACGEPGTNTFSYGETGWHVPAIERGYPAGCTTPGLTDYADCSICGEVLQTHKETPPAGHTFETGDDLPVCLVCGYQGTEIVQGPDSMIIKDGKFRIERIVYRFNAEGAYLSIDYTNLTSSKASTRLICYVYFYDENGNWTKKGINMYGQELEPNETGTCVVHRSLLPVPASAYGHRIVIE